MKRPTADPGDGAGFERLSTRQAEILELIAKGLHNDEIAGVLGIAATTVRTHVTAVLARLELTNRTEAAAAYVAWAARPARIADMLVRPAIAVLPIATRDSEPATRTVAWALGYDLAALFARWCWFPVIAHAATLETRAPGDSLQHLGERLGASFLVDGTLRTDARAARLQLRIDDVRTGCTLWTERYEFAREQLFAVQDAVCEAIVAAVYPVLVAHTHARLQRRAPTTDLTSWDLAHEGMRLYSAREPHLNEAAETHFRTALGRDPDLVFAHYGLGLTSYLDVLNQHGAPDAARARLHECGQRCVALAPHAAEGYYLLGRLAHSSADLRVAVSMLETAIARNPSFAAAHAFLAQVLQLAGDTDQALVRIQHATRLDPRSFVAGLATLLFLREDYPAAHAAAQRAVAAAPRYAFARVIAVACAWWAGDRPDASRHFAALCDLSPNFTISRFSLSFGAERQAVQRISAALHDLGAAR
jgi:TolB-like protein